MWLSETVLCSEVKERRLCLCLIMHPLVWKMTSQRLTAQWYVLCHSQSVAYTYISRCIMSLAHLLLHELSTTI